MKSWILFLTFLMSSPIFAHPDDIDAGIQMTIRSEHLPTHYYGGAPGALTGEQYKINKAPKGGPFAYCYIDNCNILADDGYRKILADHENAIINAAESYGANIDAKMSAVKDDMQRILNGALPKLDSKIGQNYKNTFDGIKSKNKQISLLIQTNSKINIDYHSNLVDIGDVIAASDISTNNLNFEKISFSKAIQFINHSLSLGNLPTSTQLSAADLADITDQEAPYEFQADRNSEFGAELHLTKKYNFFVRRELTMSGMLNYTEDRLLYLANHLLGVSDEFFTNLQDPETARSLLEASGQFIDMAIGIGLPIYGTLSDAYEFLTGTNKLTGEELSAFERTMAGVGVLTAGYGSKLGKAIQKAELLKGISFGLDKSSDAVLRVSKNMIKVGQDLGLVTKYDIQKHAGVIQHWKSNFKLSKVEDASEVNLKFREPPYPRDSKVFTFHTTGEEKFVRVHGLDNAGGRWILRAEDIKGLSASEIARKFNIKDVPTQISEVTIPPGTSLKMGLVGKNEFGDGYGSVQYYIDIPEGEKVPAQWLSLIGSI